MFAGLTRHLWCDLLESSSNLVPQISTVSCHGSWSKPQQKRQVGSEQGELGGQGMGPHDHMKFHRDFG
jgi:hypothetical protein